MRTFLLVMKKVGLVAVVVGLAGVLHKVLHKVLAGDPLVVEVLQAVEAAHRVERAGAAIEAHLVQVIMVADAPQEMGVGVVIIAVVAVVTEVPQVVVVAAVRVTGVVGTVVEIAELARTAGQAEVGMAQPPKLLNRVVLHMGVVILLAVVRIAVRTTVVTAVAAVVVTAVAEVAALRQILSCLWRTIPLGLFLKSKSVMR